MLLTWMSKSLFNSPATRLGSAVLDLGSLGSSCGPPALARCPQSQHPNFSIVTPYLLMGRTGLSFIDRSPSNALAFNKRRHDGGSHADRLRTSARRAREACRFAGIEINLDPKRRR